MRTCEHVKTNGERCRQVCLKNDDYCYWHSEQITEAEKQQSRRRGGHESRRVEPMDLEALPESINDTSELRAFFLGILRALAEGRISPAASRALIDGGRALRETFEYDLVAERLAVLERETYQLEGPTTWHVTNP